MDIFDNIPPEGFFIAFIVVLFLGVILYRLYFSRKAVVKRKLKKTPMKDISHFNNGEIARIVGKIEFAEPPLIAPLSQRECAYYAITVEQKKSSGKNSYWRTIIEDVGSIQFVIKQGYQHAYIDSKNIKSYVVQDKKYSSGFLDDASQILESFLSKHGYSSENFLGFNKSIRYAESILEKDEMIAVLGQGHWKRADQIGLPSHYDRILVLDAADGEPVYLSDDPDTLNKIEQKGKETSPGRQKRYKR